MGMDVLSLFIMWNILHVYCYYEVSCNLERKKAFFRVPYLIGKKLIY